MEWWWRSSQLSLRVPLPEAEGSSAWLKRQCDDVSQNEPVGTEEPPRWAGSDAVRNLGLTYDSPQKQLVGWREKNVREFTHHKLPALIVLHLSHPLRRMDQESSAESGWPSTVFGVLACVQDQPGPGLTDAQSQQRLRAHKLSSWVTARMTSAATGVNVMGADLWRALRGRLLWPSRTARRCRSVSPFRSWFR